MMQKDGHDVFLSNPPQYNYDIGSVKIVLYTQKNDQIDVNTLGLEMKGQNCPGGPVPIQGPAYDPCSQNQIPYATTESLYAANSLTWHS